MAGYLIWFRATTPEVPSFKTDDADPAVAKAILQARAEVEKSPRSGAAWGRLGMVLSIHDFLTESEMCFATAERFDPKEPRWPYFRGLARSDDSPEYALPCLQRASQLCDPVAAPHLRLAEMLTERGRLDEAEVLIRRVDARDPNDARALLGLGRLALARGELKASLEYLRRSTQLAPEVKATQALLAIVLQRLGDEAGAEEAQRKATKLPEQHIWPDPFLIEINRLRTGLGAAIDAANHWLRQGRTAAAVTLMEKAARDYPDKPRAWMVLGKALTEATNFAGAEQALRKAVALEPTSLEGRVDLGGALFGQGKYSEAEANYREAIRQQPGLAEAWFNLGLCRMNQRDNEGAIEAFREATRLKPDLALAYVRWGQALGRLRRIPEAMQQLKHALELNPNNAEAKEMLRILETVQLPPLAPK
jgi:tetratricopeptide (TPR) repeat protein